MKKLKSLCSIVIIALSGHAFAVDLGVKATVYPIVEQDIREAMMESANRVKWDEVTGTLKDSAKDYLDSLPKRSYPRPDKTVVYWMDPSIELSEDIQAPVKQADGTFKWGVLFPKGTRVNPLESNRPSDALVFFDGSDAEQLAWVKELLKTSPAQFVPIETGNGKLSEDNKYFGRGVYHAQDEVIQRFNIQYLPSIVFAGEGEHQLHMATAVFASPLDLNSTLTILPKYLNLQRNAEIQKKVKTKAKTINGGRSTASKTQ